MMKQEIQDFKREDGQYLYLSSKDFLVENAQMIMDMTAYPEYMDQEVVDQATQVIYQLTTMQDGLFEFVLEADENFRKILIKSLENINLYGRLNDSTSTVNWVRSQLKDISNSICSFDSFKPAETYTYESDRAYEIGLSLYKFDREIALHTKRGKL